VVNRTESKRFRATLPGFLTTDFKSIQRLARASFESCGRSPWRRGLDHHLSRREGDVALTTRPSVIYNDH